LGGLGEAKEFSLLREREKERENEVKGVKTIFLNTHSAIFITRKSPQKGYNQGKHYTENRHPTTMLTPEGEIQSPKAVGVGREKDSLPTKLEN
jgi:hypothetical protein